MTDYLSLYDRKPWYRSRGVWGGILSAFSGVVMLLTSYGLFELETEYAAAGAISSGALSVVGRLLATRRIA